MHAIAGGLRTVLSGVDRAPSWLAGRPVWLRRLTVVAVVLAVVVGYPLCAALAAQARAVSGPVASLLALGVVLPVALLIRYPLLAWRVAWLAGLVAPLAPGRPWGDWPWDPPQIPVLVLAFVVAGLRYGRPALWTMWALMLGVLWLGVPDPSNSVGGSLAFTAFAAVLDVLADRWRTRRALATEREHRTALEGRAQLARELHDVVAHHMSLIAVQAETAPYRHPDVTEPVRDEFAAISATARDALTEMRRLLGVLRREEPASPPLAPQPGMGDLADLVDGARRAGLVVRLSMMDGAADGVPATVGLCVYRVVQESLSNAGRHAAGAAVTVTLEREGDRLRLSVHNGLSRPDGPRSGRGHGLAGMRERVALLGGSLSAGPDATGGFAVVATFPLADAASGAASDAVSDAVSDDTPTASVGSGR
jgi:signal transduction histidine kinase